MISVIDFTPSILAILHTFPDTSYDTTARAFRSSLKLYTQYVRLFHLRIGHVGDSGPEYGCTQQLIFSSDGISGWLKLPAIATSGCSSGIGVGVAVGLGVGVGVGIGLGSSVDFTTATTGEVGVGVGTGVGVAVGFGVGVGRTYVNAGISMGVAVGSSSGVAVGSGFGVCVGVG